MDPFNYNYNGKLWKASLTVSDKNSFFHAAFGVRTNEDEPYLDKRIKFRRMRWASFLSYFEEEIVPLRLAEILKNCLSLSDKYKHATVEDQDQFNDYVSHVIKAERDVAMQEIPILATLENVKVVLFKDQELEPTIIIPDNEILGSYPNVEKSKGEVVLYMEGNVFSRMNPLVEDRVAKSTGNKDKTADVKAAKESTDQSGSGLIRYQKGGNAGSEGVQYQVGLLTVFFLNALQKLNNWRLSTENTAAGKLDDVVMEWPEGATLLQAKHKQNNKKKITFEELVSTNSKNDDFSIPKYFLSYEKIKETFKSKDIIICTNAGVDGKAMKYLKAQKVNAESLLHYENCDYKFYTFRDEILPHLKENVKSYYEKNFQNKEVDESTITDENIRDFMGHLQLFFNYPPGNDVAKVTEQLLSHMKLLKNLYFDVSPLDIYTKILDWFQQREGVYVTELYAKAIFSEIWRDKRWQRLEKYDIFFQCNNLNLQTSKKLFHLITEGGCLLQEIKVFRTLQSKKTNILFVGPDDKPKKQKQVVDAFGLPQYTILVLIWPKVTEKCVMEETSCKLREIFDKFGYKKVVLVADCNNRIPQLIGLTNDNYDIINKSITLEDLLEVTQGRLLENENIIFQGNNINLKKLFLRQATEDYAKFLSTEELEKLVRGETVKVGAPVLEMDEHIRRFYIKRKFKRETKTKEEKKPKSTRDEVFSEELICEMNDKVVLISDSAGMGKSTVLTNLAVAIKEKYPHLWVIRIDLNDYTQILKDFLGKNRKTINIVELLNSNHSTKFANQLELSVFSMNKKVVLMLDGFDEISPDYTQLVLSLLSLSQEQQNFAKVIVTTRPHLVEELEEKLQVEPLILEPFTEQNQIDFLTGYWMHHLAVDNTKRDKCEEYAKAVIKKLSSWVQPIQQGVNHFAAIPLHVRMLAEIFQEDNKFEMSKDWEGCKEYVIGDGIQPKLPENMNVTRLYKMFIEKKQNVFIDKGNPSGNTAANQALMDQFEQCLSYHRSLALELILNETKCELFLCQRQTQKNFEVNILKIGIVQKIDNKFHFAHRTFAEYFVAESITEELQLLNENKEFQKFIIEEILSESQFYVICVFLNCFVQQVLDNLSPNIFYNYQCSKHEITLSDLKKINLLHRLVYYGHVANLRLILKCINLTFTTEAPVPDGSIQFFSLEENIPKYSNILEIARTRVQRDGLNLKGIFVETTLLEQSVTGSLEMVQFLLEQGANIDIGKLKPIHLAVEWGNFKILKCLVEHGADIKIKGGMDDCTVLYKAVLRNNSVAAAYLLDRMLQSDGLNTSDPIIPYTAAYLGRLDALEKLTERSMVINGRTETGETAVFGAVRGGQLETIRYLVRQGCDINSRDQWNHTVLHIISQDSSFLPVAKLLVELGIDVNAKNFNNSTALHVAVKGINFELVELLIGSGAEVNVADQYGVTPLHIAAEGNNFDLVQLLVNCGADVTYKDVKENTALHVAAENFRLDIMKYLVEQGANMNSKNKDNCTPLYLLITKFSTYYKVYEQSIDYSENLDLVKYFIKTCQNINIKNCNGCTLLHLAAGMDQLDIVDLLVESGIDIDITDNDGRTALHLAALEGYLQIVEFLVLRGADSNIKDNNGHTVLHYLVCPKDQIDFVKSAVGRHVNRRGNDDCHVLRLVIENGGDPNLKGYDGSTALHFATRWSNLGAVIVLVESRVNVNATDDEGRTALHLAVSEGHFNVVEYLVKTGANVTITDNSGHTVLHLAANRKQLNDFPQSLTNDTDDNTKKTYNDMKQYFLDLETRGKSVYLDIVKVIVAKSSKIIDIEDKTGCTAMHLASLRGNLELVNALVQHGACVNNQDSVGCTALHITARERHMEVAKFLLDWGVDFDIRDNEGRTPLHLAAEKDALDIVVLLVEFGSDVDAKDKTGSTALHKAVSEGYFKIVEYLVEAGVDIRIKNNCGCTALHLAVKGRHSDSWSVFSDISISSDGSNKYSGTDEGIYQNDEIKVDSNADSTDTSTDCNLDGKFSGDFDDVLKEFSEQFRAKEFNLDIVKTLLTGCNEAVDIRDDLGRTALHFAALGGSLEVVEVLAKHNADVNIKDKRDRSALQLAIDYEMLDIAKLLVKYGADINDRDSNHRTVLHLAAEKGDLETVVFFIKLGIDVDVMDDEGNTPLQLALDGEHLILVKYLVEKGADITRIENYECMVLHLAAKNGDLDNMIFFVNRVTDITVTDEDGNTALHSAVHKNRLNIVEFLVDLGIDLNVKNNDGQTALHLAFDKECLEIAQFLLEHGADTNVTDNRVSTAPT